MYRVYTSFAEMWEERDASERGFKRQFPTAFPQDIENTRSRGLATPEDEKDRVMCWNRITWTETAKSQMPDWMLERYAEHFESEGGETDDEQSDSGTGCLTPSELDIGEETPDRDTIAPLRGTITAVWENRYGQPVAELDDGEESIDLKIVGFDSPETTPLSGGVEYVLAGLRYRSPEGKVPYFEFRPTVTVETLERPESGEHAAETDAVETADEQTEDSADDDSTASAAADGGTTTPGSSKKIEPPANAEGPRANVATVARVFARRGIDSEDDAVTSATAAGYVDELSPEEVRHALEKGKNRTPAKFLYNSDHDVYWLWRR
jgi:hypothetical protein